jgi:N-acetylhexosamine 1-kinase
LELAVRFLTDYLNGDLDFKTCSADHNLVRARTQIRLVQDIEAKWDELCAITVRCRE